MIKVEQIEKKEWVPVTITITDRETAEFLREFFGNMSVSDMKKMAGPKAAGKITDIDLASLYQGLKTATAN